MDLLFNVLVGQQSSKRQAKLHGNAHAFCRADLAVYADRLFGDCGALSFAFKAREADGFLTVQKAEMAEKARCSADFRKVNVVL